MVVLTNRNSHCQLFPTLNTYMPQKPCRPMGSCLTCNMASSSAPLAPYVSWHPTSPAISRTDIASTFPKRPLLGISAASISSRQLMISTCLHFHGHPSMASKLRPDLLVEWRDVRRCIWNTPASRSTAHRSTQAWGLRIHTRKRSYSRSIGVTQQRHIPGSLKNSRAQKHRVNTWKHILPTAPNPLHRQRLGKPQSPPGWSTLAGLATWTLCSQNFLGSFCPLPRSPLMTVLWPA